MTDPMTRRVDFAKQWTVEDRERHTKQLRTAIEKLGIYSLPFLFTGSDSKLVKEMLDESPDQLPDGDDCLIIIDALNHLLGGYDSGSVFVVETRKRKRGRPADKSQRPLLIAMHYWNEFEKGNFKSAKATVGRCWNRSERTVHRIALNHKDLAMKTIRLLGSEQAQGIVNRALVTNNQGTKGGG